MNLPAVPPSGTLIKRTVPRAVKDGLRRTLTWWLDGRSITYKELSERPEVNRWDFGRGEAFELEPPAYYNELPAEIERLLGTHRCHQPYVIEVPNVEVFGRHGFKVTEDDKYIVFNFNRDRRASTHVAGDLAYDFLDSIGRGVSPLPHRRRPDDRPEIDLAVPLLHRWATNYNHWTEEWLPQLKGLHHYTDQTGNQPTILIPPDPPDFIPDSLKALGHATGDWIEWHHDQALVRKLVLPSIRRCYSDTSDDYMRMPSGIRWVRDRVNERLGADDDGSTPSRVLISRADADSRRIVNREAVIDGLSELGFEPYVLSELDFFEQQRLFSTAETIVGTHGAGLTNLIYASDATVLELFGDYLVAVYYEMSQYVGHKYGCLKCDSANGDIYVDVDELLTAIQELERRAD